MRILKATALFAQFIPNPFAPIPLNWIPFLFFSAVFIGSCLVTWFFLKILSRAKLLGFLRSSGLAAAITIGLLSIWLCWPNLNDYSEVVTVAKPGINISVVVSKFGQPSEIHTQADGTRTFLYAEGMMTGYTSIETDPNDIIVSVGFVD